MAENVGGHGFCVCVGLENVTETRNEFKRTRFMHLEVG